MEEVHILPTNTTPEVLLNPKGIIKIKGRAIDEDLRKVPDQIMNWIDAYLVHPAQTTEVTVALEYLNSFNTIIITSILKKVSQVTQQKKNIAVHWYYEEDDDDLYERAQYISTTIDTPFEFIPTDNLDNY